MATYTLSALTSNTLPATGTFAISDQIFFDNSYLPGASAAGLTLRQVSTTLQITYNTGASATTISLLNFDRTKISSTNFTFLDGSQLLIGDNSTGTVNDASTTVGNTLISTDGDDFIDGMGGADDTVSYATASSAVTIALSAASVLPTAESIGATDKATVSGGGGSDVVINIENIIGSAYNDTLTGTSSANKLDGGLGIDTLVGGDGNDTYIVTAGDTVTEASGKGTDTVISSADYTLPSNVENLTLTSIAVYGTGNTLANTITGNSLNNVLDGVLNNSGVDSLVGMSGNDTYLVRNTGDVVNEDVTGSGGTDTVYSFLTSNYTLPTNVENLRLMSTSAGSGTGNELNNIIYANGFDNSTLDGGEGTDTLSYQFGLASGATTGVTVTIANDASVTTTSGGSGADNISNFENVIGSRYNDSITGGTDNNVLTGGFGNDTLTGVRQDTLPGTPGNDTLDGGAGNDTYVLDAAAGYVIIDSAGNDTIKSSVDFSIASSTNIENLTAGTNASGVTLTGNALANTLNSNNTEQDDTLIGGTGNDTYKINSTADTIIESSSGGTDTVVTSTTDYTLADNVENLTLAGAVAISGAGNTLANTITASALDDTLLGGDNNDTLVGGDGNNRLDGELGNDKMTGGLGNDTYVIDSTSDTVTELSGAGTGIDTVLSSVTYTLGSNLENLTLTQSFAVNGTGNSSKNFITGNTANNILTGNGGSDTFVFLASSVGNGKDTITDFTSNDDKLDFGANTAGLGSADTISLGAVITTANFKNFIHVIDAVDGSAASLTTGGTVKLAASDLTATTLTNLASFLKEHWTGSSSNDTTDTGIFVLNSNIGTTAGNAYVYQWDNDASVNAISASELKLIGTVTAETIANTDVVVAKAFTSTSSNDSVTFQSASSDTYISLVGASATVAAVGTANGTDTITGFNVSNDILGFSAIAAVTAGATANLSDATITSLSAALTTGDNVLVLDDAAPFLVSDATALAALTTSFTNVTSGNLLAVYSATANGDARVALITLTAGDITTAVDLVKLVGVDVDTINVGNFTLA